MSDVDRRKVTGVLQREADRITLDATAHFETRMRGDTPGEGITFPFAGQSGGHVVTEVAAGPDEARSMLREGFQRLGGVVSLAVLVDEPGLIADDLQWLKRMLGARKMLFDYSVMFDLLLDSYLQACMPLLSPPEIGVIRDSFAQAKDLLTGPSSNA